MESYFKTMAQSSVQDGTATLTMKIPGVFKGLDPGSVNGWSGRMIIEVNILCGTPNILDAVTSVSVEDTDGVIPVPAREAFPNYPVLFSWSDSSDQAATQGRYFKGGVLTFKPINTKNKVPSGVYLIAKIQKGTNVADTIVADGIWDDLT